MPRLAPPVLKLTQSEREQLSQIVNRHSTPQQIALRARIILLADEGYNHQEIVERLHISRDMARQWRQRWLENNLRHSVRERLSDAARSGTPATFSLSQIVKIFALACEKPSQYGRAVSHWTSRELAEEAMKQGIVESISPRHVGRLLNDADLKPHQSQYWLNPPPTLSLRIKPKISVKSISGQSKGTVKENGRSVLTK